MSTQKQITANRANARKSSGPKSKKGKAASAGNARRHSIFRAIANLTGQDRRDFTRLAREYRNQLRPSDPIEEDYVRQFVEARWRLLMCRKTEAGFFDEAADRYLSQPEKSDERLFNRAFARAILDDPSNCLIKLVRYEQTIRRGFDRAFKSFYAHRDAKNDKTKPNCEIANSLPSNYFPSRPDVLACSLPPSNEPNSNPISASNCAVSPTPKTE